MAVFPGNTSDLSTFSGHVEEVRERFCAPEVVFVEEESQYLQEHPRARASIAARDVRRLAYELRRLRRGADTGTHLTPYRSRQGQAPSRRAL